MKTMSLLEAKHDLSRALRIAQKDVLVITRRGKPIAVLERVTEEDLEDYLLERSPKFWAMIDQSRRGRSVPLETVRRNLRSKPKGR